MPQLPESLRPPHVGREWPGWERALFDGPEAGFDSLKCLVLVLAPVSSRDGQDDEPLHGSLQERQSSRDCPVAGLILPRKEPFQHHVPLVQDRADHSIQCFIPVRSLISFEAYGVPVSESKTSSVCAAESTAAPPTPLTTTTTSRAPRQRHPSGTSGEYGSH